FALRKPPAETASRPPAPVPAAPVPAPVPVAAPVADAELSVDSTPPGAAVFLDDERIGETPLARRFPVDARHRNLPVESAGYRPEPRDIVLDHGHAVAVALKRIGKPRPLDLKEGR